MTPIMALTDVDAALRKYRLPCGTEELLQAAVAAALTEERIDYVREYRLSRADRIDFYLPPLRIGIECKTQGSPSAVTAQLLRYAGSPEIDGLLLVTRCNKHAIARTTLAGKPFLVQWIGASQL